MNSRHSVSRVAGRHAASGEHICRYSRLIVLFSWSEVRLFRLLFVCFGVLLWPALVVAQATETENGVTAGVSSAEAMSLDPPAVQLERTEAGAYRLQAGIEISAPLMIVWDVLTDCGQALRYIPGMLACEVLEAGENYDVARHSVRKYRLLPTLDYIFRSDYRPHESISVQLVEGDLETLNGQWQFASCGEVCTQISYDFTVASAWLVPGGIERRALREDVPEMLQRLKRQSTQWFEQIQRVKQRAEGQRQIVE